MPVTAVAAAALPPMVVATDPATAAKAGAASPPAGRQRCHRSLVYFHASRETTADRCSLFMSFPFKGVTITTCAVVLAQLLSRAGRLHPDAAGFYV